MPDDNNACPECGRKIMQSISNRCMYCGADLPEEHHLSQEDKARFLAEKMERLKANEENADDIISSMRKDFAIPEKKGRKSRKDKKQDNAAALAEALSSIKSHTEGGNNNSG